MMLSLKNVMMAVVETLVNKFEEDQAKNREMQKRALHEQSSCRYTDNCSDSDSSFNQVCVCVLHCKRNEKWSGATHDKTPFLKCIQKKQNFACRTLNEESHVRPIMVNIKSNPIVTIYCRRTPSYIGYIAIIANQLENSITVMEMIHMLANLDLKQYTSICDS